MPGVNRALNSGIAEHGVAPHALSVNSTAPSLLAIQGLRGLAAIFVVMSHAVYSLNVKADQGRAVGGIIEALGHMGVLIFFAISGFIMVLTTRRHFGRSRASIIFFTKRIIRIVPLYWATTIIYALKLAFDGRAPSFLNYVQSLFFVPYRDFLGDFRPIYGLGWSLNYEIVFYVIFGVSLLLPYRRGVALTFAALIALGITRSLLPEGTMSALPQMVQFWCDPIVMFFLAGMMVGHLHATIPLKSLHIPTSIAFAVSAVVCGGAIWAASIWPEGYTAAFLAWSACGLAVALCAFARSPAKLGLSGRLLSALGDSSYSLYLTHSFVLGPLARILGPLFLFHDMGRAAFVVVATLLCVSVGWLCFIWFERPLLRVIRQHSGV
jgi:exopolysaccharide production protein ExoZ